MQCTLRLAVSTSTTTMYQPLQLHLPVVYLEALLTCDALSRCSICMPAAHHSTEGFCVSRA
jgi:hypothetical protein